MNTQEIKQLCRRLMETSDAVYLTTIDPDGFPDTRAMLNLRNATQYPQLSAFFEPYQESLTIYFSTNTSSQKIQELLRNPKASVYYCLPKQFQGVMLSGQLEQVPDMEIKCALWQENWTMYYPGGVEDPDNSVLRLVPRMLKGWANVNRFQLNLQENA